MQYTSKIALLAVAFFGASALAAPFVGEDNDLSAREVYDAYLEARSDPSLDARELEELEFEAREYLDFLEARAATVAATEPPQSPMSSTPKAVESHVEVPEHGAGEHGSASAAGSEHLFLTKHQKHEHRLRKIAAKKFKDAQFYHEALLDESSKFHHFAVLKYLSKLENLKKALANTSSPYHHAAKRVLHHKKAKEYLADKKNYRKALKHKHNQFHKDAVKMYFKHGDRELFLHALTDKDAKFHKIAVHEYLLDRKTRQKVLADEHNQFYEQAVKLQKKINKHHRHLSAGSGLSSAVSAASVPATKA